MNDPCVVSLTYNAAPSAIGLSFAKGAGTSFTNELGSFDLANGALRIRPAEYFKDVAAAREAVEPFLRSWEMDAALRMNPGTIRFTYESADVVDRRPPEPGAPIIGKGAAELSVTATGTAAAHLIMGKYPAPPVHVAATSNVAVAFRRWQAFTEGKEPLQAMAYFVFTVLTAQSTGLKGAAGLFNVDQKVLKTLSELSSTRGGEVDARKLERGKPLEELTSSERAWLEAAVRLMILRMGECAAGAAPERITMATLPNI